MTPQPPPDGEPGLTNARTFSTGSAAVPGFGPYRFLQRLGEGGMGEVWLAEQLRPVRRKLAIKIVKAGMDSAQVVARFEAERQALAVMDHPAIAKVFDGGTTPEGRPYFAMEYVRGEPIIRRTIREKNPLRPSTRITKSGPASTVAAEQRRTHPAKLSAALRGDLDWITTRAREKDRTRRYQTANALGLDVRRYLAHEPVAAGPPSAAYRARKFVRRHRIGVGALAALLTLAVAFAGIMTVQAGRIARERDRANQEATIAKQVSDFLVGLFSVSDPSEARGASLTAREILDRGAVQIEGGLRDQPLVQARLQATIGTVYTGLGMYAEAQPLLERALQTQRQLLGEDSPESLATANHLANAYWYERKYPEAESLYRVVVQHRTRLLGEDHQDTLRANFDLASVYLGQNRLDEFEQFAHATLAKHRRVLGNDHGDTLSSMNNMQNFYYRQGRYAEAEPLGVEVFEARRRILGDDHPRTLVAVHNLATIYDGLGRHTEAEPFYLQAVEARRRVLGDEHPQTCLTLSRLASMYMKQQRYQEAESAALAAYRGYGKRMGDDHEDTTRVAEQLADVYVASGQPGKAEEWRAKLRR